MSATGHPDGECADVSTPVMSNKELFNFVIDMINNGELPDFDQVIYEYDTNCLHLGYRANGNRRMIGTRTNPNNYKWNVGKIKV